MSKAAAKRYLTLVMEQALQKSNVRQESAEKVSFYIISKKEIAKANKVSPTGKKFTESYNEFLQLLLIELRGLNVSLRYINAHTATAALLRKNSTIKYAGVRSSDGETITIFARNYADISDLRTNIAKAMPEDKFFGLEASYSKVKEEATSAKLAPHKGKFFILKNKTDGRYGIYRVSSYKEFTKKGKELTKYKLNLQKRHGYFTTYVEEDAFGVMKPPQKLTDNQNGIQITPSKLKSIDGSVVLEVRDYSAAQHLGHIEDQAYSDYGTKTIIGERFSIALDLLPISSSEPIVQQMRQIIQKAQDDLAALHGELNYNFKNILPELFNRKQLKFNGKIVSSVALISTAGKKVNLKLAPKEQAVLNNAIKNVTEAVAQSIKNVPGSNTLKEDLIEAVTNATVSILSGKPAKKIKPHEEVKGKADLGIKFPKIKLQSVGGSGRSTKSKTSSDKETTSSYKSTQLRTTTGQFYGLVPLQRLLDASLVQRVKDNMGTGSRRDILNLRTGRFAESVRVERLSQSREGMITAFYSYMKNPYATFSQGGRQELPKTRDPKLLIAKSIREIGATMVGNRMRAVLV